MWTFAVNEHTPHAMNEHPRPHVDAPDADGAQPTPEGAPLDHLVTPDRDDASAEREGAPPGLTYQLRFEQFRHIATLSVAAAGGTLIMLQAGYVETSFTSGTAVALFALAAALSLIGQDKLLDGLESGRGRTRAARILLGVTMAILGAGVGMLGSLALD